MLRTMTFKNLTVLGFFILSVSAAIGQYKIIVDTSKVKHVVQAQDTAYIYSYINRISDIDFHNEQYRMEIWFLITYKNSSIDFEKGLQISGSKRTDINYVWTGKRKGLTIMKMKASCIIAQDWDTEAYPFDEQELTFKVYSPVYINRQLVFKSDEPNLHNDTIKLENGWKIIKDSIIFSDEKVPLDEDNAHSVLTYKITIHREYAGWIFFKLFIGMYVAFFVAFLAFFIDVEHVEPRFGLPVGALFAAIANKYIVESILPETPVFTIADWLHSITFLFIMIIIGLSVISLNLHTRMKKQHKLGTLMSKKMVWLDKRGAVLCFILYFVLNIFFLYWSIIH